MKAYERFITYAKVFTTSSETSGTTPSTQEQFNLLNMLKDELVSIGIANVVLTDNGYLYAKIPATKGCENKQKIGFIAHVDTAPAFSGENVQPILHKNYDGGDIVLANGNKTIKVSDFPLLKKLVGKTVITADGTTLLGADDKAGIAEIVTMAEKLITSNIAHGQISIGFTPDEEIGAGANLFDVNAFDAQFAYTMDGDEVGTIEYENFNAAAVNIDITGVSVHPGSAKDVLVNALLIACEIQNALPCQQVPEKTSGYEGFFFLSDLTGDNTFAKMEYIIRDHDEQKFEDKKALMQKICNDLSAKHTTAKIELTIKDSYFNMKEKIKPCMHLIENAKKAATAVGLTPQIKAIRGGTDGARLSYMGLPCPNLGTGGQNFHGPYELIAAEDMDKAVDMILEIVKEYSK